jgi:hypothetical protein
MSACRKWLIFRPRPGANLSIEIWSQLFPPSLDASRSNRSCTCGSSQTATLNRIQGTAPNAGETQCRARASRPRADPFPPVPASPRYGEACPHEHAVRGLNEQFRSNAFGGVFDVRPSRAARAGVGLTYRIAEVAPGTSARRSWSNSPLRSSAAAVPRRCRTAPAQPVEPLGDENEPNGCQSTESAPYGEIAGDREEKQ